MFSMKLMLVICNNPYRKEIVMNKQVYIKNKAWNFKLNFLKLFMMIGPLVVGWLYYIFSAKDDLGIFTFCCLMTFLFSLLLIQLVLPDDILERLADVQND